MLYIGSHLSSQFLSGGWFGYPKFKQGSLVCHSLLGCTELNMTEQLENNHRV